MTMAAKDAWSDDEEDTPLAFVAAAAKTVPEKHKAKPQEKKQAERKEKPKQEKKSKASTNGAAASSKGNANTGRGREAMRSSKTPSWQKIFNDHGSKIAVAVCIIAILYFR